MKPRYHLTVALPESLFRFVAKLGEENNQFTTENVIAELLENRIRELARDTQTELATDEFVTGFGGKWMS